MQAYGIVHWVVDGTASPIHGRSPGMASTLCGIPIPVRSSSALTLRGPRSGDAGDPSAARADLETSDNPCFGCIEILAAA